MPRIDSSARVDPKANIAADVEIGPCCIVGPDVTIGSGCRLIGQCFISGNTTLGKGNIIYPFVSIGTHPQDYGFKGEVSYLHIGDNNIFREGFTANVGTKPESETIIGNHCFFMANSHVAHNCKVGDNVVMANGALIGGYAEIGSNCLLSGNTAVHQFCRMGRFAVLSGCSAISVDLPPFVIAVGNRNGAVESINRVGLRRNNFSEETMRAIKNVYKIFFRTEKNIPNALEQIRAEVPLLPEVMEFIQFVETSKRGVLRNKKFRELLQE